MEEDVTFRILDRGVKVSRSEILRRLKRASLMRYGYKKEISTNRHIENNKSEFKVSPAIFFLTQTRNYKNKTLQKNGRREI